MKTAKELCKEAKQYLKKCGYESTVSSKGGSINIFILSGPVDMIANYLEKNKNGYAPSLAHIAEERYMQGVDHNDFTDEAALMVNGLEKIVNADITYHEDGDYGHVPSRFVWINVGYWHNPYQVK